MIRKRKLIRTLTALTFLLAVPFGLAWITSARLTNAFKWGDFPIIPIQPSSEESLHVEYPSVYLTSSGVKLLYSAYGDDHRWRLKLATSSDDGNSFTKQGNIFSEKELSFEGNYAFPFVREVQTNDSKLYELYFAASDDGTGQYSALYRSRSINGLDWSAPEKFLAGNALDPIVLQQGGKDYIIFTARHGDDNVVMKSEIGQNGNAGVPSIIYTPSVGLYTLGLLKLNGKNIVVVENERSWTATCFGSGGTLLDSLGEPVASFYKKSNKKWDSLKYGMDFVDIGETHRIYYNGIEDHGVETGGQIGTGTYDPSMIAERLNLQNCQ
ncbi:MULTISPECIES: hypothetical protein [unclassified Pseudomonas]|uniref:hypothetical protein n=1 Tax=unclassified Pseudomonas TaxID=196821 RepID=UPI00244CB73B|nr:MULTISPECIES: hypothetical protein [unclassified Pseudomonas]MDH0896696.1 hypothetical protein [Pseudomonas sp. GD03875]MDH1066478.1 hypothetical protein [Pseudomonas sp. GD03985]